MKFKPTLLALAVAGTVAAPVAVQAGADEIYASARVGIWNNDTGGLQDTEIRSFASRFGARGETDLGNGMTGFGRYEWGVDFNGPGTSITNRHRYVGLKGGFGSVLVGQTYQTWYNFVVGPLDNPWWWSGNAMIEYRGRTDNAITYAGGADKISFGATMYFENDNEEEPLNGYELGASFQVGDTTVGAAVSGVADGFTQGVSGGYDAVTNSYLGSDDIIYGLIWSGIGIANTTLGVSFMGQDKDMGLVVDWQFGNPYFHLEYMDVDSADQKPYVVTLGYTQSLGRKTTMYYELAQSEADTGDNDDDQTSIMAVLKYDII